ncbi:MAG: hypothetical protein HYS89_02560 [Candidatus Colwellbacteria bacterium]|nr:hypothetical protein [Candidatus Colwellbacteria bacterium]
MKGVSALPVILLVSMIILELAIAVALTASSLSNTFYGERMASEALSAARAGAEDAIIRVIRYKNCPTTGCPASYTVTVGSRTADVTIASDGSGHITINSTGAAFTRKKKVQVILGVNSSTGEVKLQSFAEVAL